jgi:hypothetical protein
MAKLRNIELPEGILAAYQNAIESAPDPVIINYAERANKRTIKGLRPNRACVPQIKKRVIARLLKDDEVPKIIEGVLKKNRPLVYLQALNASMVKRELDGLCAVLGRDKVIASALLDDRKSMQELAKCVLRNEREIKPLSHEEAEQVALNLHAQLNPLMTRLSKVLRKQSVEDVLDAENQGSSRIAELEQQIEQLNKQHKKLTEERDGYKKRALRSNDAAAARSKTDKENEKLRNRVQKLEQELKDAQSDYAALDAALVSTVDERVHSALHGWIQVPEKIEAACRELRESSEKDLIDKTDAIIKKQEEVDRHAGNRRVVQDRLDALLDRKQVIDRLAIESINPIRELAPLRVELDMEIARLRQLLQIDEPPSECVQSLKSKIAEAASLDDLVEFKHQLDQLDEWKILPIADLRALHVYLEERTMLQHDKVVLTVTTEPLPPRSPVHRIRKAIADNSNILWFLDGHNVLFGLPDLFGTLDDNGNHTEDSRKKLSDFLVQLVVNAPNCRIELFFDSPQHRVIQTSPNVSVIYSGGEGDHKADNAICDALERHCAESQNRDFVLTTDDKELQKRAGRLCAEIMNTHQFYILTRQLSEG